MGELVQRWTCLGIKPVLMLGCFILYFCGFSSAAWLKADNREWTLWWWCFTNCTDQPQDNATMSRCHSYDISLTPSYFIVVEVFACLGMVGNFLLMLTFLDRKQQQPDRQRLRVYIQLATALMILIAITMFARYYKSDVRWEHLEPDIAAGFIAVCVSCGLSIIIACVHWTVLDVMAKRKAAGTNTVRLKLQNTSTNGQPPPPTPPPPPQQQQGNGAGGERISSQRQTRIHDQGTNTTTLASGHGSEPPRAATWSTNFSLGLYAIITGSANDENEHALRWPSLSTRESNRGRSQFPVLSLPPYELYPDASLSGPYPAEPPPPYEVCMQNSGQIR